ncbi:MAG: putative Na+/H+ antiporter [Zoogloeaceae bacterium]|jgi:uncharacterized membrane protein|nr:putative Na+/H+ antiporter [Zoogloeaceae bacterium]
MPTLTQIVGTLLFTLAVLHTFSTKFFLRLAHAQPRHAGLWHLLGEVETVFGFWSIILVIFLALSGMLETRTISGGLDAATSNFLDKLNYTEPMFVFAIMVVAASRPIIQFSSLLVRLGARMLPVAEPVAFFFMAMSLVPLLGSFITEPAAMTLAAMMLADRFYRHNPPVHFKYAVIGTLFVNVSIGGTLTNFAAPPVLMVAHKWDWSSWHMLSYFGWRSAIAIFINTTVLTLLFRRVLRVMPLASIDHSRDVPPFVVALHVVLLGLIVLFSHHPVMFLGILLIFMGLAGAYPKCHDKLILREALMVAFFLAGLVTLGSQQEWWMQALMSRMNEVSIYFGATALTTITDNAALTYLGSLVPDLSDEFKYAMVAGAVTGGGMTVIANAPNPAGMSILRGYFARGIVSPLWLAVAAALPTLVAIAMFQLI